LRCAAIENNDKFRLTRRFLVFYRSTALSLLTARPANISVISCQLYVEYMTTLCFQNSLNVHVTKIIAILYFIVPLHKKDPA